MLVATNLYLTRTLAKNSTAVLPRPNLAASLNRRTGARIAFGEIAYWLTDLAVSLLTPSERNAAAARGRMDGYLDQLALTQAPSWSPSFAPSATSSRNSAMMP